MTVSDRFLLFLREKGINQKDFSKKTGYLRQTISKFVTGNVKSPKIDLVVALMTYYPELNIEWFLLGKGEMWKEGYNAQSESELPDNAGVSAVMLGRPVGDRYLTELLETKDTLIDSLMKRIEYLEEEVKRLKSQ